MNGYIDVENPSVFTSFLKTTNNSYRKMDFFRNNTRKFIDSYIGSAQDGKHVPVNFMAIAIIIYVRRLIAKNPQFSVTPKYNDLARSAAILELAVNHQVNEMKLVQSISAIVLNALFGIGVIKKGIAEAGTFEFQGHHFAQGKPFIEPVSMKNLILDLGSESKTRCRFVGDMYDLPYEAVVNNPEYDKRARDLIPFAGRGGSSLQEGFDPYHPNEYDDPDMESDHGGFNSDILPMVTVADIWLPAEGLIVTTRYERSTFFDGGGIVRPLKIKEVETREGEPYDFLTFNDVPDSVLPVPPASQWHDLHDLANKLFKKLGRQASRQKTIGIFSSGDEAHAKKIRQASDGEIVSAGGPHDVKEVTLGGIDQVGMAFYMQVKDIYSYVTGNLDSLGGLGVMADTARQEGLISDTSSEILNGMADRVTKVVENCGKDLAYFLAHDPFTNIEIPRSAPGFPEIQTIVSFSSETVEGDYLDYNFKVVPYSMQDISPQQRLEMIGQLLERFYMPYMEIFLQQGVTINGQRWFELIASLSNQPELIQILAFSSQSQMPSSPIGSMSSQNGGNTRREYVRTNKSEVTDKGKSKAVIQSLLSGVNSLSPQEGANMQG